MRGLRIANSPSMGCREKETIPSNALDTVIYENSVNNFKPGDWSPFAIFFSSAVFMMGHRIAEWPAAFVLRDFARDPMDCQKRPDIVYRCSRYFQSGVGGLHVYFTDSYEYW